MRNRYISIVAMMLFVLSAYAQPYAGQTTIPNTSFQSTSTMSGSGSAYSSNPTLNEDGTAAYSGAQAPAPTHRPYKAPPINPRPGDSKLPLGDALIPLLLMVMAYAISILLRRRKSCV